ncbi:hypothetical protein [Hymenobacter koreensis]|uniref:Uncharacterized protein n=1 Tax=Hymenobacter koreensis TaxID=1084523 RepID=A0ABP8JKH0_9BACT
MVLLFAWWLALAAAQAPNPYCRGCTEPQVQQRVLARPGWVRLDRYALPAGGIEVCYAPADTAYVVRYLLRENAVREVSYVLAVDDPAGARLLAQPVPAARWSRAVAGALAVYTLRFD